MNKHLMIIGLTLALGACTPPPTTVPALPSPASNIPATLPATPAPQNAIPATLVQPTETAVAAAETVGMLWLQVLSPQDEEVVNAPQVEVIGSAPAGSVISVNDEILLVSDDGQFKTTVPLEEGPNLIEIVASDDSGNETFSILTVTYEP